MVETVAPARHSPLEAFAADFAALGPRLRLLERPFRTMVDVRRADPEAGWEFRGLAAPGPLASSGTPDRSVLWLGPGWWLVVDATAAPETVVRELDSAGSCVDVSAWRTILDLGGPNALDVLETGCSIDLHPRAFGDGACAQTLLARCPVLLQRLPVGHTEPDGAPVFRIFVRASYACYLAHWLLDAVDGL